MKLRSFLIVIVILLSEISMPAGIIPGRPRISSFPYVSGDTFREYADIIFDEDIKTFNPQKVHNGSVIFVKRDFIDYFISNCHPFINHPYILITHNSDYDVSKSYKSYLDDEKLIVWFAQNVNYVHPKLIPIPIGFANRYLTHGDIHAINAAQALLHHTKVIKNKMLYLNFNIQYFSQERRKIFEQLQQKSFSYSCSPKPFQDYLIDIVQSYFVASPRGNGIDCHRTWETLAMGSIPIVESSSLDPLFEDLPVVIIQDWSCITEEFLQTQLQIMQHKKYNLEKAFAHYWLNLIDSYKVHA